MPESRLTSKGQITIPKAVRERLNLEVGDSVSFDVQDDGAVVMRTSNLPWDRLRGLLRQRGRSRVSVGDMSPERAGPPDEANA